MTRVVRFYLFLLLLGPLVGYISFTTIGIIGARFLSYIVLLVFFIFIMSKKYKIVFPKFLYFLLLYIIYIYTWNFYNGELENKGLLKYIFNNFHIYTFLIIIMLYSSKYSHRQLKTIIILIQLILIIALVGSILQLLINPRLFIRPETFNYNAGYLYQDRRVSIFTYMEDNDYGISMLAYLSLIVAYCVYNRDRKSLIFFLLIGAVYSILTNGRYVMVGFIILSFQLLFSKKITYRFYNLVLIVLIIIVTTFIISEVFNYNFSKFFEERLNVEGGLQYSSRYYAYLNFLKFFPENPIWGTGVHMTVEIERTSNSMGSSQIHVGYLSHLVSYGLVGSILLFSFWFFLARDLFLKARLTGYYGASFAFLTFLWANVTFVQYYLFYPGIIISIAVSQYYYNQYVESKKNNSSVNSIAKYN